MKLRFVVALQMLAATQAFAADFRPAMQDYLDSSLRAIAADPAVVQAILDANAASAGLDQAAIDALDAKWRAEVGQAATPTITPVLENPVADKLRASMDASGGKITEIILMDAKGLNVAATGATSDMWQGDEDKFAKTYPMGRDAVFFGEVELDESTQTYQGQISISIVDPASKAVIGAMTVGVNAEALM